MAQLAQGLRLDLPDSLTRDVEEPSDLLERAAEPVGKPEAEVDDLALAVRKRVQYLAKALLQQMSLRDLERILA